MRTESGSSDGVDRAQAFSLSGLHLGLPDDLEEAPPSDPVQSSELPDVTLVDAR